MYSLQFRVKKGHYWETENKSTCRWFWDGSKYIHITSTLCTLNYSNRFPCLMNLSRQRVSTSASIQRSKCRAVASQSTTLVVTCKAQTRRLGVGWPRADLVPALTWDFDIFISSFHEGSRLRSIWLPKWNIDSSKYTMLVIWCGAILKSNSSKMLTRVRRSCAKVVQNIKHIKVCFPKW